MSQIPPTQPPYGQQPYGQPGFPPPGGPGVPAGPGGYSMPPRQGNGMAVTSLILGLAGCVPVITGLGAILFGILGIKRSKVSNSGKGLAIAGLILGVISVGFWALSGSSLYTLYVVTKVNRDVASQFIKDLDSANITAAANAADTTAMNPLELAALSVEVKSHGTVKDVTTIATVIQNDTAELTGVVDYGATKKTYQMKQKKVGDTWKVTSLKIE